LNECCHVFLLSFGGAYWPYYYIILLSNLHVRYSLIA